jgi:transcriptional regulator with XRE-family HTH domain
MAPGKAPEHAPKPDKLAELGKLIESALARHGASARSIAQRAGIGASHLSKFLKAQRSLRQAKLMILADLLGLDRDKVLRLAGFGRAQIPRVELGRVTLLRALEKFTLNVVMTPRFYDGALFLWLFSQQPFAEVGVQCQIRRAEWGTAPAELASYGYSVGLHSHLPSQLGLVRWSHLCLDKGAALIGRGREALAHLLEQAKRRNRRLSVIAIDATLFGSVKQQAGLDHTFELQIIPNADVALESFQAGAGDLFLGGLPQRLVLRRGEYRELVAHGKDFPRLYSFQSLICSTRMLEEKRPLLHAIDALWYDVCRQLYAYPNFRTLVFEEILELLDGHGIERHHLIKEDFEWLFTPEGKELEVFAQTPAQLLDEESALRQTR